MPNTEYDTRTPEEKKKLLKGMHLKDDQNVKERDPALEADSSDIENRRGLHRHTA